MAELPDWMRPPRPEGWLAADLDHLPHAPRHTELIDGALVFRMWPQQEWHSDVTFAIHTALAAQAPQGMFVNDGMTLRLDDRTRLEPDVVVATTDIGRDGTWYDAKDAALVIEVSQAETAYRDRTVKFRKYAEAGVPHYWRIVREDDTLTVYVYELDDTRRYVAARIVRGTLRVERPFHVEIEVRALMP